MKAIKILFLLALCIFASCKKDSSNLEEDLKVIDGYLKANNISTLTYKDIRYTIEQEGTGKQCTENAKAVAFFYKLYAIDYDYNLTDIVDQSPANKAYVAYMSELITGMQYALATMKEGGKATFYIPAFYAYGSKSIKDITRANLKFEVELCEVFEK